MMATTGMAMTAAPGLTSMAMTSKDTIALAMIGGVLTGRASQALAMTRKATQGMDSTRMVIIGKDTSLFFWAGVVDRTDVLVKGLWTGSY